MNKAKRMLSFALCMGILCASVPAEAASTVKVKRGDTLSGLSHKTHISVSKLKSLNHIKGSRIYIGQVLHLSLSRVKTASIKKTTSTSTGITKTKMYKIKRGDSLSWIGKRYHVSVATLKSWNHLHSSRILIGQTLIVAKTVTTAKPKTVAAPKPKPTSAPPKSTSPPVKPVQPSNLNTPAKSTAPTAPTGLTRSTGAPTGSQMPPVTTPTQNPNTDQPNAQTTTDPTTAPQTDAPTGQTAPTQSDPSTTGSSASSASTGTESNGSTSTGSTSTGAPSGGQTGAVTGAANRTQGTPTGPATQTGTPQPAVPTKPVANGKVILLDPGHGGKDSGAVANGLKEVNINWAFSQKLKTELEKRGYKVILSHAAPTKSCLSSYSNTHSELQCRLNKAYQNHANLYLAIHANAMPYSSQSYVHGLEVHYNGKATKGYPQVNAQPAKSKSLATLLNQNVAPAMKEKKLGLINDSLYVTRMAKIPSVLIEMGYLTNISDAAKLKSSTYQQRAAIAMANASDQYFKKGN